VRIWEEAGPAGGASTVNGNSGGQRRWAERALLNEARGSVRGVEFGPNAFGLKLVSLNLFFKLDSVYLTTTLTSPGLHLDRRYAQDLYLHLPDPNGMATDQLHLRPIPHKHLLFCQPYRRRFWDFRYRRSIVTKLLYQLEFGLGCGWERVPAVFRDWAWRGVGQPWEGERGFGRMDGQLVQGEVVGVSLGRLEWS
jgi:hypothetical protein